tara:strand:+ start:463 stop:612 length:150 start_codon:yes stop_codon:yes gene_type:complete
MLVKVLGFEGAYGDGIVATVVGSKGGGGEEWMGVGVSNNPEPAARASML